MGEEEKPDLDLMNKYFALMDSRDQQFTTMNHAGSQVFLSLDHAVPRGRDRPH